MAQAEVVVDKSKLRLVNRYKEHILELYDVTVTVKTKCDETVGSVQLQDESGEKHDSTFALLSSSTSPKSVEKATVS